MSHIRITSTRPDGTVVDRLVEIENARCLESALARAFAEVLGGRCAARQATEGEQASENSVTLQAFEGPRAATAPPSAGAVARSRVIGRFEVVRRKRGRKLVGTWYGAEGELRPSHTGRRG